MKVEFAYHGGEAIVVFEGVVMGRIGSVGAGAGYDSDLVTLKALIEAVKEKCAALCESRALAHDVTKEKAKYADAHELHAKGKEARKCADGIRKL